MSLPTSPESRGETYLAAIAGQDVTLPASPESRMEQYLEDIAEKMPVANPTLAGTEDNLTGLEVRGVKYKVPEGGGSTHLYRHDIYMFISNTIKVIFTTYTSSGVAFTQATLAEHLNSTYESTDMIGSIIGWFISSGSLCTAYRVRAVTNNSFEIRGHYTNISTIKQTYEEEYRQIGGSGGLTITTFNDVVKQIL